MSLIETLKQDMLQYRKDAISNSECRVYSTLLGSVIAEASKDSKDPSDDHVTKTLRKFEAGIIEFMHAQQNTDKANLELKALRKYIKAELSEEETRNAVRLASSYGMEISLKNMRAIKEFVERDGDSVNGSVLAKVVRENV